MYLKISFKDFWLSYVLIKYQLRPSALEVNNQDKMEGAAFGAKTAWCFFFNTRGFQLWFCNQTASLSVQAAMPERISPTFFSPSC